MPTKRTKVEVVTSVRLTRKEYARLKALAASQQRSISQQIRFLVQEADA